MIHDVKLPGSEKNVKLVLFGDKKVGIASDIAMFALTKDDKHELRAFVSLVQAPEPNRKRKGLPPEAEVVLSFSTAESIDILTQCLKVAKRMLVEAQSETYTKGGVNDENP